MTTAPERATVVEAAKDPCVHCPWLEANHGKPHPDGWYTAGNRKRLWAGMRQGEQMTCHPTDPANPVSDEAVAKTGRGPAPVGTETKVCAGAEILQLREVKVFEHLSQTEEVESGRTKALALYRRLRPGGMSRDGIVRVVERIMLRGALGTGVPPRMDHDLDAPVSAGTSGPKWPALDLPTGWWRG